MKRITGTKVSGRTQRFEELVNTERSNLVHWTLEKAIVDLCVADGLAPLTNKHIDLFVRRGTTSVVFEIKPCPPNRTAGQIRQGIYQLLEYRFLYRDFLGSDVRLCVVAERPPSGTVGWLSAYMEHLEMGLLWRDEFRRALVCRAFTKKLLGDIIPGVMRLPSSPTSG